MSNRFEKAIKLKKSQDDNLIGKSSVKEDDNLIGKSSVKEDDNLIGKSSVKEDDNLISLKEQLIKINTGKTQITINLSNENLKKLDKLVKETGKSRAYIIDYLLKNYLD